VEMKTHERGLSLVELLIVVAVIGLLVAVALPQLTRARVAANEAAVLKELRAVQSGYAGRPIDCSRPRPSFVGTKSGYVRGCTGMAYWARPEVQGRTGQRGFAADATGRICQTPDGSIPEMSVGCDGIR
jgi:prepilin-type N-terminal cleavage/methylation domain-containing protein